MVESRGVRMDNGMRRDIRKGRRVMFVVFFGSIFKLSLIIILDVNIVLHHGWSKKAMREVGVEVVGGGKFFLLQSKDRILKHICVWASRVGLACLQFESS